MRIVPSAIAIAAALVSQAAVVGCGSDSSTGGVGATAPRAGEDSWQRIQRPTGAAHGLHGVVPVLVDDRVVVIAGVDYDQTSVKGLVIDPSSRRASRTAPSRLWWRFGHSAVAARDEVIVWGGCCGPAGHGSRAPGAIYDVEDDRWRAMHPGPLGNRHHHTAVWAGEEMIVWGGIGESRRQDQARADGAAYDPRTDSWRTIAPAPLSARQYHVAAWTGDEMIVWGGSKPLSGGRERLLHDGAAYDPERDEWRRIPSTSLLGGSGGILPMGLEPDLDAEWTGQTMIVWSRYGGAGYSPEVNRWQRIPPPPDEIREVAGGQIVWSGDELIAWGGEGQDGSDVQQGAAFDPRAGHWRALPAAPISGRDRHAAISTPQGMLVWGGCCERGTFYYADGALHLLD